MPKGAVVMVGFDCDSWADVGLGGAVRIIEERQRIKERTMKLRKQNYKKAIARVQTVA